MLGGEDRGDSPASFSDAHAGRAVGRSDSPTHSCLRSVVDDNGNPIFRNNICLEDRRLTSSLYAAAAGMYICVYACTCTECSISAVTSSIPSFYSIGVVTDTAEIEENNKTSLDGDN